jgi:hypothetical protein
MFLTMLFIDISVYHFIKIFVVHKFSSAKLQLLISTLQVI